MKNIKCSFVNATKKMELTDNTNIPSGRYLLSTKKEIYVKDAESFNMTSIFSFKKCPST